MATDDLHALFKLLVSPLESLLLLLQRCILCEDEASQLALHIQLTHQQWEHCSKWSRSYGDYQYDCLACSQSFLLHLLVKLLDRPPDRLLWELQILAKGGLNCFSWHVLGLREFPGTLPPVILHFSSDIGDGSLCNEVPLIRHCCHRFLSFTFW